MLCRGMCSLVTRERCLGFLVGLPNIVVCSCGKPFMRYVIVSWHQNAIDVAECGKLLNALSKLMRLYKALSPRCLVYCVLWSVKASSTSPKWSFEIKQRYSEAVKRYASSCADLDSAEKAKNVLEVRHDPAEFQSILVHKNGEHVTLGGDSGTCTSVCKSFLKVIVMFLKLSVRGSR